MGLQKISCESQLQNSYRRYQDRIIPTYPKLTKQQEFYIYADEAEILNMALFGMTSKQWREQNPEMAKANLNIRDAANVLQLTVLSNLESLHSHLIREGAGPAERLEKLKEMAVFQLKSLSQLNYNYSIESPCISIT
jgi:hypothetical protein